MAAIIGGGNGDNIQPGEVSLAQNGILFLDEFAQMPKNIMEALRGPLEDRKVVISRLRTKVEFPASFMLVAASNPCPCGYYGVKGRCTCTPAQRQSYMGRLSGPIMDRIDIQLSIRPVPPQCLVLRSRCEPSAAVAERVLTARKIQTERFRDEGIYVNAEMTGKQINKFCPLDDECMVLMEKMSLRLGLSARAFSRVLKLARTIADLEKAAILQGRCSPEDTAAIRSDDLPIRSRHILESFTYRFLDRPTGISRKE